MLGNCAIPLQGKSLDSHFIDFLQVSGHLVQPAKYSVDWRFQVWKLAQIVSVGTGIRPQKGPRDNFTREPPCLQQSILGVPVCMKPSLTSVLRRPDTRASYLVSLRL